VVLTVRFGFSSCGAHSEVQFFELCSSEVQFFRLLTVRFVFEVVMLTVRFIFFEVVVLTVRSRSGN